MAALKELLPPAKSSTSSIYDHTEDPWFKNRYTASEAEKASVVIPNPVPPYLKRKNFIPRKPEDFGDGGAFPEILVAQYPLGMGRRDSKKGSNILPVTVDSEGNVAFDAIVRQNENSSKIVQSKHRDLVPKILKDEMEEEEEEEMKEIEETTEQTKAALEKIVNVRLSAAQPKNVPKQSNDSKFIKYKPSQQSAAFNSGAKERIIRMVEMPVDPLEPPKFKHKRVPRASGSPPVPVMHSPPRPVTVKDQQDWKIPPCISNWKNPKGYTIPLDKRLAADGRGLQEVQINDNFAKLSEALYVAEQKAREAVAMRSKVQKEMAMKEKEKREQELRALALKARNERIGGVAPSAAAAPSNDVMNVDARDDYEHDRDMAKETKEEREARLQREKIREERRRERERERRLEAKDAAMGKKSKITRDRDRDISEKVALGMASAGTGRGEVMYDQRLFNQDKGMDSGFATDDQYNVYSKGLFTAQPTLSTLYRPKKDVDSDTYGGADEQLEKIMKTERFKPDKEFTGTSQKTGPRDQPMEFEKEHAEEADPFGLDQFLTEVKKGKKAMDKIGGGGTMKASGGSTRDGYDGGSGRNRIAFERVEEESSSKSSNSKDKKSNGSDSGKDPGLTFKLTSKVPYKTVLKAHSAVILKAESMADKVEWLSKLKNIAQPIKGGQIGESGHPMRQSLSDGSLDTMTRRPADPEEELRWMSQEVRGYVEAVLNSLAANVPKAVVLCQVEKAKEDMLNQLYSSVSSQSSAKIEELLQEDGNVKRRRDCYQKQSSLLSRLVRQLSIHDNRAAAASIWSDTGAPESSPRTGGPVSDDWRSAFDSAANGPSDLHSSSSRFGSSHSRRYSDPAENGDVSSGSRRTPTRLPPAPPSGSRY